MAEVEVTGSDQPGRLSEWVESAACAAITQAANLAEQLINFAAVEGTSEQVFRSVAVDKAHRIRNCIVTALSEIERGMV